MTRSEARRELAENLMLLAEALLDDENAGQYKDTLDGGELKVTSVLGNSTTVIAIKNWGYDQLEEDDEWSDTIE
jgi:hypothetical protein